MTTPLSDLLPHLGELTASAAERWVAAALAEAAALRAYDDRLYPLADGTGLEAARRLHEAWRLWAEQAEALLVRLGPAAARGHVLGLDDLRFLVGRCRGLRALPPDEVRRRHGRAASGEASAATTAEVRRDLGLTPLR